MGVLLFFLFSCHKERGKDHIVYPEILSLDFYPIEGKAPLKVSFNVTIKDQNLKGFLINWDFNSDDKAEVKTSLLETTQEWVYKEPGNYVVKVEIVDNIGKVVSEKEGLVRVKKNLPPVISSFQVFPMSGRVPLKVVVHLDAVDPDPLPVSGAIKRIELDMDGDGRADISGDGNENQWEYVYRDPGIYHVFAYAYDDQNDFSAAGPVTVSVFLPPPVIENPDKQIWHAGGGYAYSITYVPTTKIFIAGDGYEGLKIYKFSTEYSFNVTLIGRELSYLDGQVIQVMLFHDRIFALFDNSLGVYYSPVSEISSKKFVNVFAGNIPFIKRFSFFGKDYIIGENLTTYSLILAEVSDSGVGEVFSYPLEYFINYMQNNGASQFCVSPQARDFIIDGENLLILMEKCIWELPLSEIISNLYSIEKFRFFDLSTTYHSYWKGVLLGDYLFLSHDYGVDLYKHYPGVLTYESGAEPGVPVGPVFSSYFGIYSKTLTDVIFLQSGNYGNNVFYNFSLTSHSLKVAGFFTHYNGIIRDFVRYDNDFLIFAVGEDGLILSDNVQYKNLKINDHMKGYGIAVTGGKKLLITTSGINGYEIDNIDNFYDPEFLYHFSDYKTEFEDIFIEGYYGWVITAVSGVVVLNRIKVIPDPPYIQKEKGMVIADLNRGENYSFYPLNVTYAVVLYKDTSLVYGYLVSGSTKISCATIEVEANDFTLMGDTLFVSDPAASLYYFSFPDLIRCEHRWNYKDLIFNGSLITPLVINGVRWKDDQILLVGGGDRRVYGFNYDSTSNSLFLRDGYPLLGNSEEFSVRIIFKDIKSLGRYIFLAMENGGFGIIDAYNAGILSYESGLITHQILIYPSTTGWVKLILRGNLSQMNNPDYPDTIKFVEIPGLTYSR